MIDEGLFLPLYFHKRKKNNYGAQLVVPKSRAVVGFWFLVRFALLLEKSSIRKALLSKNKKTTTKNQK